MPAVANLTINDGQSTPVEQTFVPVEKTAEGVWIYEDQSAEVPLGYRRIYVSLVRPPVAGQGGDASKRMARVKVGIYYPVLEALANNTSTGIPPAPTVAYVLRSQHEFMLPERSTTAERKNLRAFAFGILFEAAVANAVDDLLGTY